ncbi:MAG: L-rhamnonate dehydratase [Alphaproteobacteria bacterium]|jgi:L-rhamnonate dehydratase|nr:L-rhamnonate dehydratase [Alphaproteobacteria bacterium]
MSIIKDIRAFTVDSGKKSTDYTSQPKGHWITDTLVANPMAIYPEYRGSRTSWGIGVLGSVVVEVELENGVIGVGISTAGPPGCWLIEHHLKQFAIGQNVTNVELIWDQMWRASMPYGRKGITIHAISAIDLAIWDAMGKDAGKPVYELLGGPLRSTLSLYATSPAAASVKKQGFQGVKVPLPYGPSSGSEGLKKNVELISGVRDSVGDGFDIMIDCYMALSVEYVVQLVKALRPYNIRWLEEPLIPDDYKGYSELKKRLPETIISSGEHEYTRYGFSQLIDCGIDILQPDMMWCGGMTEARRITNMAAAKDIPVIPHGSGVYAFHHQVSFPNTPFAEFLMLSPKGDIATPQFGSLFKNEPLPKDGKLVLSNSPGFGIELNKKELDFIRLFAI